MQYRPILNVGIGTDCDGFGVVSSNGGREPDGGVFVEDYVANDGGVGCYPGRGSDARDVGSKFVYSFHLDGVLWVRQPTTASPSPGLDCTFINQSKVKRPKAKYSH